MKSHVNYCSSFKTNQIEMLVVDLNAMINEGDNVEFFEFNFLLTGIAHSALAEDTDHLFKHFNDSTGEDDDSDVKMC